MRHNPFFRRMGCMFFALFLLGLVAFIVGVGLIVKALGWVPPFMGHLGWMLPFGLGTLFFFIVALVWTGSGVRRVSVPLDDLLAAAERLAKGDYSVRLTERGPREIRSLAQAFNSMAARLEVTDASRRNFLADVTHELRTPLTVIQGNLEGMLDGVYSADEARLKSLLEETQVLSRLVEDLRTLILAESGALQLRREPTDLAALIRDEAAAFKPQADAAGVEIKMLLAVDAPPLEVDPGRIREVLSNLIANALRYTPRGGSLLIRYEASASPGMSHAAVSIADSGPGIASGDLPHVFDRFYKTGDSGGMGLGLSIAKTIVEAHGGEINAQSRPGEGTVFTFVLPHY